MSETITYKKDGAEVTSPRLDIHDDHNQHRYERLVGVLEAQLSAEIDEVNFLSPELDLPVFSVWKLKAGEVANHTNLQDLSTYTDLLIARLREVEALRQIALLTGKAEQVNAFLQKVEPYLGKSQSLRVPAFDLTTTA
jgi:hypothetical protein